MLNLAILGLPGGWEWIIILLIGLVLFGRRLPEVGRSLGKSIVEFKKGIRDIEDDVDAAVDAGPGVGTSAPARLEQGGAVEAPTEQKQTVSRQDPVD